MTRSASEKRREFRRLHEAGCFVLPNPWDVGSAAILAHLGFKALASTSAGMAWSIGRTDGAVSLDETLLHLSGLAHATDLPLNADFEKGFADAPAEVAANVALAIDTGVSGLSIEDYPGREGQGLYPFALSVERVAAAKAAIARSGADVMLTARSEGFIRGAPDLAETIRRLQAFADAGADCLYAPGLREEAQIAAVVEAAAPRPVNVLANGMAVEKLAGLGVRRISLGGSLAGAAYGAFARAARQIAGEGIFSELSGAAGARVLNPMFQPAA